MRLIIAGGRHHRLSPENIIQLNQLGQVSTVISGGASGIDSDGEQWAHSRDIPIKIYLADWSAHGKMAGPLRNRTMAENADALAIFPGGKGTESMYKEANKLKLKIFDFRANAQLHLNFDKENKA
ncbi:SLOG family protein [Lentisphaera profundi]|uniref:SLOG family protein n=1 Tax=Lentisphaera profundi TaxID=1658616 RepID=A0ABY7VP17_9BACT|nr:SLOG family protein [Lentisphaera profundi]WDE95898.1 SLOG family protein [Lentisphaera profundi]